MRLFLGLGLRNIERLYRAEREVIEHGLVREEIKQLEHKADAREGLAVVLGEIYFLPVYIKLAAVGSFQPVQAADEGALTGTGRPDDADHLALLNVQGHIVHGLDAAEGLFKMHSVNHSEPASSPVSAQSAKWSSS